MLASTYWTPVGACACETPSLSRLPILLLAWRGWLGQAVELAARMASRATSRRVRTRTRKAAPHLRPRKAPAPLTASREVSLTVVQTVARPAGRRVRPAQNYMKRPRRPRTLVELTSARGRVCWRRLARRGNFRGRVHNPAAAPFLLERKMSEWSQG